MTNSYVLYFTSRTSAGIFFFLTTIILLNYIPIEVYAQYSLAISTAQIIAFILCTWVGMSAALMIPGLTDEHLQATIAQHSQLNVVTSVLAGIFVWVIFASGAVELPNHIALAAVIFCFAIGMHETQLQMLNAQKKAQVYSISTLIRYAGGFVGISSLALFVAADGSLPILVMAGATTVALLHPEVIQQCLKAGHIGIANVFSTAGTYFAAGIASIAIFGLWTFTNYANRLALHWMASTKELGSFAAVTDLLNGPVVLIFQIFNLTFGPLIVAAARSESNTDFKLRAEQYLGIICFAGVTITCVLWFAGPGLVSVLKGGAGETVSGQLAGWVVMNSVMGSCFGAAGLILMVTQHKLLAVALTASTLLLNVIAISAGESAYQVAKSGALSLGLGTFVIWFLMLSLCRVRIPRQFLLASLAAALLILFSALQIGSEFYSSQPILSALVGVGMSVAIGGCFNLLEARTIALRLTRSFLRPS